jgi:BCCT family betaine/carnitine transporter
MTVEKPDTTHPKTAPLDKAIFWPSLICIVTIIVWTIAFEEQAKTAISAIFSFVTDQLGFIYIWAGALALGAVAWLGFGKYSHVRLGGPDARPEFKRLSWMAMFFCSGIGTALLYWATIEWSYYYTAPPFGIEAESQAAAEYAAMYGIFHWGPIAWAFYVLTAFPIGYAYYNRKKSALRLSTACSGIIGDKRANGKLGKAIDILMIFGLVGGTGTSLASGTPMLAEAISQQFGIEHTFALDVTVVAIWTCIFITSVVLGLKKGIKVLSDINLVAVIILCSILFIGGPTFYLINTFTDSIGLMLSEFTRMTFYTDPIRRSMFPQWWTIFYWAWWVAYGPFMGIFIARISKGRTFKDIALSVTLAGSTGCGIFFMIFGNIAMHSELNGLYPMLDTIKNESASAAILGLLMQMPLNWVILPLFILVGFVYSGTTVDSSAYVLASVTSKNLHEGQEPNVYNRLFWAVTLGGTALVLMNAGGLVPLKTASLMVGLPLVFLMGISFCSLLKWLKEDYPQRTPADTLVATDAVIEAAGLRYQQESVLADPLTAKARSQE